MWYALGLTTNEEMKVGVWRFVDVLKQKLWLATPAMATYKQFKDVSKLSYYINSAVAVLGILISLILLCHSLYEWIWKDRIKNRDHDTPRSPGSKKRPKNDLICTPLSVLITVLLLFFIYAIEFLFFRIFPPLEYNYSASLFCKWFVFTEFVDLQLRKLVSW